MTEAAEACVKTNLLCMAALCLATSAACSGDPERDWGAATESDGGGGKGDAGRGGKDDDICGKHAVVTHMTIPDLLIVLDRSGSMARNGNSSGTDRWRGSRDAVIEVTGKYDDAISFGLMTFPKFTGGGGGGNDLSQCVAGDLNVDIKLNAGDDIASALERMNASGYTPTAATLEAALSVIGTPVVSDQTETSAKYLMLITDGDPNCSADFKGIQNGQAAVDPRARTETVAAIEKLTKAGVLTYVVGFQTSGTDFAGQLDMMATAGGTGETKHRSVASGDDLSDTFNELAGRAQSCSFQLAKEVDPTFVLVTVGKTAYYQNRPDGWILGADQRSISLTGKACSDAQAGQLFEVEVQCDVVVPPVY